MSETVRVDGPSGAYQANQIVRDSLENNRFSLAIQGATGAKDFFYQLLNLLPELGSSQIHSVGVLVWSRGSTDVAWAITANEQYENQPVAVFFHSSEAFDHLTEMLFDLMGKAQELEIEASAVVEGTVSAEIGARLNGSTVIPAQIILDKQFDGA
ncbi:hypothetical protein [Glutamicibacter ardleyensis]|uniref:hypothetical protein n=1 Tax=Glutamicibacter ardleyensis TaxID=225894 RepID=UPI003FD0460D